MRIARLIAAVAVAVGGFGLAGCQGDPDTRHAEAGSYDSQRVHDRAPSGSPSTGAGVGTSGVNPVFPDARTSGTRPDVDRGGAIVQPGDAAGTAPDATGATRGAGAGTGAGASVGSPAGTGVDRPTDTTRRVPNLEPGDRGAAPAGSGTRGTSAPGLNGDGIRRGSGGGGNDTRD